MKPGKFNLVVPQGSTYRKAFRWAASTPREVLVASVSVASPAVVTTSIAHGLPTIAWPMTYHGRRYDFVDKPMLVQRLTDTTIQLPVSTLLAPAFRGPASISYHPPVDLTDCTGRMQVRPDVDSDEIFLTFTTENAGLEIDPQGMVTAVFKDVDTDGVDWRKAVYDIEILFTNGDPLRFVEGSIKLDPNVTREPTP